LKKAFITGCTGQDGSFLADLLLEKDYQVYGLVRRSSTDNRWRIKDALANGLVLVDGDVTDQASIQHIFKEYGPFDECYNLAAQSHVGLSWKQPVSTIEITGLGCVNVLEALRQNNPECKFYQASTSELMGNSPPPQNEETKFNPRSPYGCAKALAHYATINYRDSYGLFACAGILYNHDSARRGENFVTQKIITAGVNIKYGLQDKLYLGNLSAKRDFSHAKDMVYGMWLMLQQDKPDEYILASGETWSIKEFLDIVFTRLELDVDKYVEIDEGLIRPAEVNLLCGDSSKARKVLGWQPQYPNLCDIIDDMIDSAERKVVDYECNL